MWLNGKTKVSESEKYVDWIETDREEATKLREYASKHDMTVTEVLQKGIDLQYAMEDSQRS